MLSSKVFLNKRTIERISPFLTVTWDDDSIKKIELYKFGTKILNIDIENKMISKNCNEVIYMRFKKQNDVWTDVISDNELLIFFEKKCLLNGFQYFTFISNESLTSLFSISNSTIRVFDENISDLLNLSNLEKLKLINDFMLLLSYQHLFCQPVLRGLTLTKIYKISISISQDVQKKLAQTIKSNMLDNEVVYE